MNKNRKVRVTAGLMSAVLVTGNVVMPQMSIQAAELTNMKKDEVVYVMTDSQGQVDSVNVVNIFGKGAVTDYGAYESVKMLTSTENINKSGDKITFTTDDDRVYYQGTLSNAEIPWKIKISYTLNGKTVTPQELAGQSGKLDIHIEITENEKCNSTFYEQYALQAAFTLDTARCENITADGATTANVGADKQISYTVLPGKGLDSHITADVTDFEMESAAINGVKLNLNVDIDDDELMEKVREIMTVAEEFDDGAKQLASGNEELLSGSGQLREGADSLYNGTDRLYSGMDSLTKGIRTVQTGLNLLNEKSPDLTEGSSQVSEALKMIQSGLDGVSFSAEQLKTLTDCSVAIKAGISELYDGAKTLQAGTSYSTYVQTMQANGLDMEQLYAANTQTIQELTAQISSMQSQLSQIQSIPDYKNNAEYAAQAQQLESSLVQLQTIVKLLSGNNVAIDGTQVYFNQMSAGADTLTQGLDTLNEQYAQFDTAINQLTAQLSDMMVQMNSLKAGIDQLVQNYTQLDHGVNEYTTGVANIVAGYSNLTDGARSLSDGSRELVSGAADLKNGTQSLYDGTAALYDGTIQLSDGTAEFYNQTQDMDQQIRDEIDGMLESLSGNDSQTISFVSDKNEDVDSVQFVIKTAEIKKADTAVQDTAETEKMNFWQKLLHLFGLY